MIYQQLLALTLLLSEMAAVLGGKGSPTYRAPTGNQWVSDSKVTNPGKCIKHEYVTGCTACPADLYSTCTNGASGSQEGCGFLGCKLRCTNNCRWRDYGCPNYNEKDLGCGCGNGEDCLYTVPELQNAAAYSGPWACALNSVDYHVPDPKSPRGLPETKTCAELKALEWCVKDLKINTRGGEYAPLWMQSNCARTCGHCNTSCALAEDKLSRQQCVEHRKTIGCTGSASSYMRTNCAGTCGYCKSDVDCAVRPVADTWPTVRHPDDRSTCAQKEATENVCRIGTKGYNSWWKSHCTGAERDTFACRNYKFQFGQIYGPQDASQCQYTCGICGTCDPKNCSPGQVFMQSECKNGNNGCIDVNNVKRFECLNLQVPRNFDQYCSDGMIDVLRFSEQSTDAIPIQMSLTTSSEITYTRKTQTAFTNEKGWNLEEMDETMTSTTTSTEVLVKDPQVSSSSSGGVKFFEIGVEASSSSSTSCMNANTETCKNNNYSLSSGSDPNMCKCVETTTTTSETFSETHATTKGEMEAQSDTQENAFEVAETSYHAETATWTCPEYTDCFYAQYTVTTTCSIPYWGTCTIVFDEKDSNGHNIRKDIEIKQHEDNKFLAIKSAQSSSTYVRSTLKSTDGRDCGVQITPAVDNTDTLELKQYAKCPEAADIEHLPHCDCMLSRFKDCVTKTHSDDILNIGDRCQLGNRPEEWGYHDDRACLSSQPSWIRIGNCFGGHVYYVGGYNDYVYRHLLEGIRGPLPDPVITVSYDHDMTRRDDRAYHDTNGYVHDGSVMLDGDENTHWNVLGMDPWHETWTVTFDLDNVDAIITTFKIMNYGDGAHDVLRCYLQSGPEPEGNFVGGWSLFEVQPYTSAWQAFANADATPNRYWKLVIITTGAYQPWIRELDFDTEFVSGGATTRRLLRAEEHDDDRHMPAPEGLREAIEKQIRARV